MADESFAARLDSYCVALGCTNKELAELCGVAASTLSRYRTGDREPSLEGDSLSKIAAGIERMAELRHVQGDFTRAKIEADLAQGISLARLNSDAYRDRLNDLMDTLSITNAEMARYVHIDPSFLSRIRNGQRFPSEPERYARNFAQLAARRAAEPEMAHRLEELFSGDEHGNELSAYLTARDQEKVAQTIEEWLLQGGPQATSHVDHLLEFLDSFDLNEYIKTIHYDELKVPTVPFAVPTSKDYYGLSGMREAELEFLKATATSRKAKEVTMFSDMAMSDMAEDKEFVKKYALGIAAMLKRGLRLNVIHDVSRPFGEMVLGLEGWIPLYMTGQVHPYYLKGPRDRIFGHLCNSSDVAALQGECVRGHHEDGRYQFTTKREGVEYVRMRSRQMLDRAAPLMNIYRESDKVGYARFLREERARKASNEGVLIGEGMFTNMTIMGYGTSVVVVQKTNEPRIAFVIRHPRLCEAIVKLSE